MSMINLVFGCTIQLKNKATQDFTTPSRNPKVPKLIATFKMTFLANCGNVLVKLFCLFVCLFVFLIFAKNFK